MIRRRPSRTEEKIPICAERDNSRILGNTHIIEHPLKSYRVSQVASPVFMPESSHQETRRVPAVAECGPQEDTVWGLIRDHYGSSQQRRLHRMRPPFL